MCWWAFTGLTHILLAGAFLLAPGFFSRESPNYFNELCKFPGAPKIAASVTISDHAGV